MKYILLIFFVFSNLFYSQNKFKDISNNRITISKFVFDKILEINTFDSSLVTRIIFKNNNIKVYSVKTYSPHSILNVCIIYKRKMTLFEIKRNEDLEDILIFMTKNNISNDISNNIKTKIKAISLYQKSDYL